MPTSPAAQLLGANAGHEIGHLFSNGLDRHIVDQALRDGVRLLTQIRMATEQFRQRPDPFRRAHMPKEIFGLPLPHGSRVPPPSAYAVTMLTNGGLNITEYDNAEPYRECPWPRLRRSVP